MAARRANPNTVKLHYSYSVGELAVLLSVHKNTVRNWQRDGSGGARRPARSDPRGGGAGLPCRAESRAQAALPARRDLLLSLPGTAPARAGYGRAGQRPAGSRKPSGVMRDLRRADCTGARGETRWRLLCRV